MNEQYANHYRILGIRPGASWKELRKAYKGLVNVWHPDRFQQNIEQRKLAEEKTKEITQAYKELAEYYKKFGGLPGPSKVAETFPAENIAPHETPETRPAPDIQETQVPAADGASPQTHEKRWSKFEARTLAVTALAGFVYFVWQILPWDRSDIPPPPKKQAEQTADAPIDDNSNRREPAPEKYFTYGSPLGEVYAIQGVPTRTERDIWYYGKSKVYFSKGKVLRWEDSPDSPLRVMAAAENDKLNTMFFSEGSSKEQVLAVQGAPDRDAENVWDYGASRVYFDNNRVKGWDESPFNPLRVRR